MLVCINIFEISHKINENVQLVRLGGKKKYPVYFHYKVVAEKQENSYSIVDFYTITW